MVRNQVVLHDNNLQEDNDLDFWLSKTPQERLKAVTTLVRQNLPIGQRMDKTFVVKRRLIQ